MSHTQKSDTEVTDARLTRGFHLMAKPSGPDCNLRCTYCFYTEKRAFFSRGKTTRMSDAVLEAYVREYIAATPSPSVTFDWQGGEPTLMGIDFFRRALAFQKKYHQGKEVRNTLQTNGTLIDDGWCDFLARNRFLVGLSMDGPDFVHDRYRVDRHGSPTCAAVLKAFNMMVKHGVEINILATINRESSRYPLEVYRFFRDEGVRFIQFVPIVERNADATEEINVSLAPPPSLTREGESTATTPWTVTPERYGHFFIRIFDEWKKTDIGRVFVMNFEWALSAWVGAGPGICYMAPRCGRSLILEHNGDIFSCDHFMYPAFRLGNILEDSMQDMVFSRRQIAFGASKETTLPKYCRECDFLFVCRGGCPKHRFAQTPDGKPGLNYLCKGLQDFFTHASPFLEEMADLIRRGIPVTNIMEHAE